MALDYTGGWLKTNRASVPASPYGSTVASGAGGVGLGTADWVGMGLQAGGALLADQEAKRQQEKEEEAARLAEEQRVLEMQRARMDKEKMNAEELALNKRGMSQKGMDYITDLVRGNQESGRRSSFQSALLSHAGF